MTAPDNFAVSFSRPGQTIDKLIVWLRREPIDANGKLLLIMMGSYAPQATEDARALMMQRLIVWLRDQPMPALDKLVFIMLSSYAELDGSEACPPVGALGADCNSSRRQVQRSLRRLTETGCIEVQREATDHQPTCYRIFLAKVATH